MTSSSGLVNRLASGWGVSGIGIYQSGYPMTVWTTAPFTAGGDYNADGDNLDYPNVTSYDMRRSQDDYLTNGVFTPGQFTTPAPGTEGNERPQQFRQPNFAETDLSVYKSTQNHEPGELPAAVRVLQHLQQQEPVPGERPRVRRLWQGDQPAAAVLVADWRTAVVLTARRADARAVSPTSRSRRSFLPVRDFPRSRTARP